MTDENIEQIANTVYELAQKEINDNTNLKRLEKRLKDNETQNKNLIDSLKMCNVDSVRQTIFDEIQKMDEERKEIEKELLLEGMQKIDITVQQIKFFLKEMRSGKIDDINYCKMLVNVLISKIYLYDDNITIIFNTQNKPYNEKIPLIEELEEKLGASSYKVRPAQPSHVATSVLASCFVLQNNLSQNTCCLLFRKNMMLYYIKIFFISLQVLTSFLFF